MFPTLLGLGVAAAASAAGYQSMAPTGQWYGRTFTGLGPGSKRIALTYDDGPNDPHTLHLLDVLAKHEVRATFFLTDRHITGRNYLAHRMTSSRMRTVKVCSRCVNDARDAGYYVTEREPARNAPGPWQPAPTNS